MTSIQSGPHYRLPASELAVWLETRCAESWWSVDGDPLLTGRIPFPCPTDELSAELRKIHRTLLVQARKGDTLAKGQEIDASQIDDQVSHFNENTHSTAPLPGWTKDRFLYLAWENSPNEWLLAEDSVTARQYREEASQKVN